MAMRRIPSLLRGTKVGRQGAWRGPAPFAVGSRLLNTHYQPPFLPETKVTRLPSGLQVATENTGHPTCTLGLWVDAGSRFETDETNGVAHFLEHMAFKGTKRRSKVDLELEVEDMGAQLNAFTSREMTAYYAKIVSKDTERAMDILADILQNSRFPSKLLESERDVILRELQEVETQKDEVIYDLLHMVAFQGNELARTILGPPENIQSITRSMIHDYITKNYTAPRIVVSAAGGVDHNELVHLSEKYLSEFSHNHNPAVTHTPTFHSGMHRVEKNDEELAHLGVAFEGVSWSHPFYFPLMVGSTIMGTWNRSFGGSESLSSPLARAVGSKDLGHSYLAFNTCYSDIGLWGTYITCPGETIPDFLREVEREWARMAVAVTPEEMDRAKIQMKTTTIMALDGTTPICEEIGRQMLALGRRMPVAEINARIDAVTPEILRMVLHQLVIGKCPAVVGIGPVKNLPDPETLRAGIHWLDS